MIKALKQINLKRALVIAVVAALLIGAIWLNISLNDAQRSPGVLGSATPEPSDAADGAALTNAQIYNNYFISFRNERNTVRAQEIEYLRMIINEEATDVETVNEARMRLMELVDNMEKEFTIESRIRAKGFLDAAVTFQGGSINVIVDGAELTDTEVARILDIVRSETGAAAENIKISLSGGSDNT